MNGPDCVGLTGPAARLLQSSRAASRYFRLRFNMSGGKNEDIGSGILTTYLREKFG